ncbi:hypothetical protein KQX54_011765 [Cotesia glomerata]|uniref:Protein Wnt n=1 Tax=Cotesia glomerata TaxID=32391 RepID=A0AAV7HE16_COTGL|nr:hypothetical protein KQX54_011765 [Cotesia glomerata]
MLSSGNEDKNANAMGICSGSCTVKTCWMRLPLFKIVGTDLKFKDHFDGAYSSHELVIPDRILVVQEMLIIQAILPVIFVHEHKPPGLKDLVYSEPSPPFCDEIEKLGILGNSR